MTTGGQRWSWHAARGGFTAAPHDSEAVVVDSWLVEDGRVVSPGAHAERFATACAALFSVPRGHTATFVRAAMRHIPSRGRWFPRVELAVDGGEPGFRLWLRPAPPRAATVRVWVYDGPDRRRHPSVKGPDLAWLADVRSAARHRGADEAVLLAADGRLTEGTTTGLLWWRGSTLCTTEPERPDVLPSVTRADLLAIAAASGVRVAFERPRPQDLDGLETWAVNALHGIRPVRRWTGSGIAAGPATRARTWQAKLAALATVPGHAEIVR